MRKILEGINAVEIRQGVFELYGFPEEDYEHQTLKKAYYTYMSDRVFVE